MIAADQPTCFPDDMIVRVSSKEDGSLLDRSAGTHPPHVIPRRVEFCKKAGATYEHTVYQRIVYDEARTYCLIAEVDAGSTTKFTQEVVADALYTEARDVALFLPVADCAATVFYDPVRHALAIAHLGRHSSYMKLASKLTRYFIHNGSKPEDIIVWMSPHAQKDSYRLTWFDRARDPDWRDFYKNTENGIYLDLAGFNGRLIEQLGVPKENIHVSSIDTMMSHDYFSHLNGDVAGRIAVIAMMRG